MFFDQEMIEDKEHSLENVVFGFLKLSSEKNVYESRYYTQFLDLLFSSAHRKGYKKFQFNEIKQKVTELDHLDTETFNLIEEFLDNVSIQDFMEYSYVLPSGVIH